MDQVKQMMKNLRNRMSKINIRKFTNNERLLATILAVILSFWLSHKFIIKPQLIQISSLKTDIDNYGDQIVENNDLIKNSASISDEMDAFVIEKASIEKIFFKNLNQAEIIYTLDKLLSKSKLEIGDITFGRPFTETIDEKEIEKMEISMPYKGSFSSLDKTIKILENENKKIIISNVDILKGQETDISGNINLDIYGLTRDEEEAESEEDSPIEPVDNNKANPFTPYKGYVDPVKEKARLEAIAKAKADAEAKAKETAEKEKDKPEEKPKEEKDATKEEKDATKDTTKDTTKEEAIAVEKFDIYVAVKGDNISYISRKKYGTERYVDEILRLNDMIRSSILPIGKKLKLRRR